MRPAPSTPFRKYENATRIPDASTDRVLAFSSLEEKAKWLDAAAGLDALRSQVQRLARRFLRIEDPEARTRAIQRWVRDHIKYQYDFRVSMGVPGEEFADTSSLLDRKFGDCDDKARAFVAIVRAAEMLKPLRVEARIRPVFTRLPKQFVHVQAEVRWPRSTSHDNAMPGGWLLSELIVKGCEIGQDPDTVPRLPNGERQII
jgi:Transglutaminase-like superfamily